MLLITLITLKIIDKIFIAYYSLILTFKTNSAKNILKVNYALILKKMIFELTFQK